jgi:hypothetical protein
MKKIKDLIKEFNVLYRGIKSFERSRETPEESYQALVSTYCKTSGGVNEILHLMLQKKHPKQKISLLKTLTNKTYEFLWPKDVATRIKKDGLCIIRNGISAEQIKKIRSFAENMPATVEPAPNNGEKHQKFDENNVVGEVYRYDGSKIIDCDEIQKLLCDNMILQSIQEYLGCIPVNSSVNMWWSTNKVLRPDNLAANAQMYHFDMDRIKWVKVFFYLTDVFEGSGEHVFVKGSHRFKSQPNEFLRRGYARISDEDINSHFDKSKIESITGEKGTMFIEDTRGYHKGAPVKNGNRLVLEFEFADSLFGGGYKKVRINSEQHKILQSAKIANPRIFERFIE